MRTQAGRTWVVIGLVLLATTLGACSDDGAGDGAGDGALTVDLDPETTTTVVGLTDGVHFGYLHDLVAGHEEIVGTFDPAELLTGEDAAAAATAAGEEPLDFFISNDDATQREAIRVDPEAEVLDIRYGTDECCEPKATDPARFAADREAAGEVESAVEITVTDGVVTRIEEIYFP